MMSSLKTFTDCRNRRIRLTSERWAHILKHPEMRGQQARLAETLAAPSVIIATVKDEAVHAYHRWYDRTPVTSKYLVVVVKMLPEDAFILTAYFTTRRKKGQIVWRP
jgi:hypothetical protein